MRKRAMALAMGAWLFACASASAKEAWPGVCSAFNVNGASAAATITSGTVSIDVAYSTDESFRLLARVPQITARSLEQGIGCNAFLDGTGRYVAVAFNNSKLHGWAGAYLANSLHFIIADLADRKVVGDFLVDPKGALRAPLEPVGFLEHQPDFVIVGAGEARPANSFSHFELREPNGGLYGTSVSTSPASFSYMVLSKSGKAVHGPALRFLPLGWSGYTADPDIKHSRLWVTDELRHQKMRSIALFKPGQMSRVVDLPELRNVGPMAGYSSYLSENSWIAATGGASPYIVSFDLCDGKLERIDLPPAPGNLTDVDGALASPDGQVFAAVRRLESTTFLGGTVEKGYRVDFVQVAPLQIIGSLRLPADTGEHSISVDHHNGVITLLSFNFRQGKWKSTHLKVQSPAPADGPGRRPTSSDEK